MKRILTIATFILLPLCGFASEINILGNGFDVEEWMNRTFQGGSSAPFSFKAGQEDIWLQKNCRFASKRIFSDGEKVVYEYVWTYLKSGLKITATVKGYQKYGAIEWVLDIENTSKTNSPTIHDLKVLDADFRLEGDAPAGRLMYSNGSNCAADDFQPHIKELAEGENLHFEPVGGRSSSGILPFFDVISNSGTSGVIVGIGWTGTWCADITGTRSGGMNFKAGMKNLDAYLKPGESIRTPSVCLLIWSGENKMTGHNAFRRFMINEQAPKIDGRPAVYPVSTGFNWLDPYPCNVYSCLNEITALAYIQRYKDYGLVPEAFWLDAGWYEGSGDYEHGKDWGNTVGNWQVDDERFPNGLRPVADAVHAAGAKFMLWFEPERVVRSSLWGTTLKKYMLEKKSGGDYLFNLSDPEAVKWLTDFICDFMKLNGVDYYRQDMNMDLDEYWADNDEQGRRGMTEIRYIEGLYRFWDGILERFPEAIIDNCASGGRRLDFETFKRSAPMWRTDYDYTKPNGHQAHTFGLEYYLPLTGIGISYQDKYSFRSGLGSSAIFNWKISEPESNLFEMQRDFKEFFEVRPYFYEDYYPLTEGKDMTSDGNWLAYELFRPSDQSGYIVAFRRENVEEPTLEVRLGGLDEDSVYDFTDCDSGEKFSASGAELRNSLILKIENKRESKLLKFHRAVNN